MSQRSQLITQIQQTQRSLLQLQSQDRRQQSTLQEALYQNRFIFYVSVPCMLVLAYKLRPKPNLKTLIAGALEWGLLFNKIFLSTNLNNKKGV